MFNKESQTEKVMLIQKWLDLIDKGSAEIFQLGRMEIMKNRSLTVPGRYVLFIDREYHSTHKTREDLYESIA